MASHFILDGYNVLMRIPELFGKRVAIPFEASREGLLQFLAQYRPQGSEKNEVTVVFDGFTQMRMDWQALLKKGIQVIFSDEKSADDKIFQMAEDSGRPQETRVVTDDRELSERTQRLKVKVVSVKEFLSKVMEAYPKPVAARDDVKKHLSPNEESKITEEFKKIWLKKT